MTGRNVCFRAFWWHLRGLPGGFFLHLVRCDSHRAGNTFAPTALETSLFLTYGPQMVLKEVDLAINTWYVMLVFLNTQFIRRGQDVVSWMCLTWIEICGNSAIPASPVTAFGRFWVLFTRVIENPRDKYVVLCPQVPRPHCFGSGFLSF